MREATEESGMSVSLKEYFESKFMALDKASSLAYQTLDKRLEGMNEFRDALKDQTKNFVTRTEHDSMAKEIQELREFRAELRGKANQSSVVIAWALSAMGLIVGIAGLIAGISSKEDGAPSNLRRRKMQELLKHVPMVIVVLAVWTAVLAFGAWFIPWLKNKKQGYPYESEIEVALLPYLYRAIGIAYKMSEDALADIGTRMRGLDKKAIADTLYDLLPPTIGGFPTGLIKSLISREKFAEMVQGAFDSMLALYDMNQTEFDRLYQDWLKANPA